MDIQQGGVPQYANVTVTGVVTAVAWDGLYIQDPAGGPWSGIFVVLGGVWEATWGGFAPGHVVEVTGEYLEWFDQSEIDLFFTAQPVDVQIVGVTTPPAPEVVPASELVWPGAEAWEGVLVEAQGLGVVDPDLGFGEWSVTDGVTEFLIGDHVYTWPAQSNGWMVAGDDFVRIAGPVSYSFSTFKVNPRDARDLEPVLVGTPTLPVLTPINTVRTGGVPVGSEVSVMGTVTATAWDGIYLQDPAGGPRSAIFAFLGANWHLDWGGIARDQTVVVSGTHDDFFGWAHVDVANSLSGDLIHLGPAAPIAPTVVTGADLQAATGEDWESMLVTVAGVTVSDPDTGFGEWTVSDNGVDQVIVDDHVYRWPQQDNGWLLIGDPLPAVTGPVSYGFGDFKVEPRDAMDFE